MRNANAQPRIIMVPASGLQQPPASHVSHAETGGYVTDPIPPPSDANKGI
jgi:hypothetical protein